MTEIPLSMFAQIGAGGLGWALLGFAIYMVLTGRLVPGSLYQTKIEEANTWKAAWESKSQQLDELLIPVARTNIDFLRALPRQTPASADEPESEEVGT